MEKDLEFCQLFHLPTKHWKVNRNFFSVLANNKQRRVKNQRKENHQKVSDVLRYDWIIFEVEREFITLDTHSSECSQFVSKQSSLRWMSIDIFPEKSRKNFISCLKYRQPNCWGMRNVFFSQREILIRFWFQFVHLRTFWGDKFPWYYLLTLAISFVHGDERKIAENSLIPFLRIRKNVLSTHISCYFYDHRFDHTQRVSSERREKQVKCE